MKLVADSGLWSVGAQRATMPTPLVAVLEVSGAILSWTVDEPPDDAAVQIAFTDLARADWLWRVVGDAGHVTLASAIDGRAPGDPHSIELTGVDIVPGSLTQLRRLALGHWLRRWWPASRRDGIAALDRAVLDTEVALLTAGAQDFFTDDTLDSDVTELLAPHAAALVRHLHSGDPRVGGLVRAGAGLADEVGLQDPGWAELLAAVDDSSADLAMPTGHQDDYALAAGSDAGRRAASAIGRGVASINWTAVPPGIFDAGEDTVEWIIEAAGTAVVAVVRALVIGPDPATGIPVRVRSGSITGTGVLDTEGRATVPLIDSQLRPMTESAAWNHDWDTMSVHIGAETAETPQTRERVRRWARTRLDRPADDTFLAEILAAESTY